MNNVLKVPQPQELEEFLDFLYEGLEGYLYVVAKVPDNPDSWDQVFFEYPTQTSVAIKAINAYSKTHEIYIAPALFRSQNAQKENVKATNVLWCDFDGNTPESFDIPPSLVVRSSEPGHEHTYWKLDAPLGDISCIEEYNRRLCYKYGADNSGWDANQVLRPPYTINHKRQGAGVTILQKEEGLHYNLSVFDTLAPAPEKNVDYALWEKLDLPSLNDVIYRNKFGPDFKALFEKNKNEIHDRSASLTNMGFICAEAGLTDAEIYVILSHLAERWEKFKHHTASSRARQLLGIIEHTRIKYPNSNMGMFEQVFEYSPKALYEADIQVDWAVDGMLMKGGILILAGESGIGKTQIFLQLMAHLAVGKPFLHYQITEPQKVGFFSLEMNQTELHEFLQSMYPAWVNEFTPEEVQLLNSNMTIIPFGEQLPLNTTQGQAIFVQYLEAYQWDGVFVDSIGAAIVGNISNGETVQAFNNFSKKITKRYNCYLAYVHHFRKPPPGTRQSGGQSDVYGDQYLIANASSLYTVMKAKDGLIRVKNPKKRLAVTEETYLIKREEGLTFSYQGVEHNIPDVLDQVSSKNKSEDLTPKIDFS